MINFVNTPSFLLICALVSYLVLIAIFFIIIRAIIRAGKKSNVVSDDHKDETPNKFDT